MFNEKPATTSLKPNGVYFIISREDFGIGKQSAAFPVLIRELATP